MWCVYEHVSPSNKVYVGITSQNPLKRWKGGSGYIRKDGHQKLFANAILKYGWDNIKHIIVASELSLDEATELEISLIRKYKSEGKSYNITDGGEGSLGTAHTEETKRKLREARVGKKLSEEHRNKAIANRVANYSYIIVATDGKLVYSFSTRDDAAKELGIKHSCNISAALAGKQCLVNGYTFLHWDKKVPLDNNFILAIHYTKINSRYKKK